VIFVTSERTTAIKSAIREINKNNQQALKEGLINAL
jgi:competence protein ComFA